MQRSIYSRYHPTLANNNFSNLPGIAEKRAEMALHEGAALCQSAACMNASATLLMPGGTGAYRNCGIRGVIKAGARTVR
jgi:hypothetical protein